MHRGRGIRSPRFPRFAASAALAASLMLPIACAPTPVTRASANDKPCIIPQVALDSAPSVTFENGEEEGTVAVVRIVFANADVTSFAAIGDVTFQLLNGAGKAVHTERFHAPLAIGPGSTGEIVRRIALTPKQFDAFAGIRAS